MIIYEQVSFRASRFTIHQHKNSDIEKNTRPTSRYSNNVIVLSITNCTKLSSLRYMHAAPMLSPPLTLQGRPCGSFSSPNLVTV